MLTPEGKVKLEIAAGLNRLRPDCYYEMPVTYGYGRRTVDFIGCFHGRFFAIEAKRGDVSPKPTLAQTMTLESMRKAGGIAIVAQSFEEVEQAFAEVIEKLYGFDL
jgi:penicillin-binding protein-related factor A (putative recombinase)